MSKKRLNDDHGRLKFLIHSPAAWARVKRERAELGPEKLRQAARRAVVQRMTWAKVTEKPRVRIEPMRYGAGVWITIRIGKWFIRAKSWDHLVWRVAFGPWDKLRPAKQARC